MREAGPSLRAPAKEGLQSGAQRRSRDLREGAGRRRSGVSEGWRQRGKRGRGEEAPPLTEARTSGGGPSRKAPWNSDSGMKRRRSLEGECFLSHLPESGRTASQPERAFRGLSNCPLIPLPPPGNSDSALFGPPAGLCAGALGWGGARGRGDAGRGGASQSGDSFPGGAGAIL